MCDDCFEAKTTVCECCGDRIWEEDANGDRIITLCNHCYQHNYTNCEECGALIHNDNTYYENSDSDYPYCYTCYQKLFESSIKSYCYKGINLHPLLQSRERLNGGDGGICPKGSVETGNSYIVC